jgi:hypothetical protein
MQGLHRRAALGDTAPPRRGSCVDLPRHKVKSLALNPVESNVIASAFWATIAQLQHVPYVVIVCVRLPAQARRFHMANMVRLLNNRLLLIASCIVAFVFGACVPDQPDKLLADPAVLQHPSIVTAFEEVGKTLSELYLNTTRDGLSFAIVSAQSSHSIQS